MIELKINKLSKAYAARIILDELSFSFCKGINYLDAPNGSGKSTLLKLISGIEKPDSGQILFDNQVCKFSSYGSYMPDKLCMYPFVTGQEFLNLVMCAKKHHPEKGKVATMLEMLNIEKYLNTKFSEMSLGSQKKFFCVASMLGEFSCLLMDEPSNAIDKYSMDVIIPWLADIATHKVIIIASHDKYLHEKLPGQLFKFD